MPQPSVPPTEPSQPMVRPIYDPMRIGYPCKNLELANGGTRTFRLAAYSDARLAEVVAENLSNVMSILEFNAAHGLLHFRLSSDLVPFASHPVCTFDWCRGFEREFAAIGEFARSKGMRLSVHPGQYVLLNSPKEDVVDRSVAELLYHAQMLDAIGCGIDGKMQIHVGGTYGDQPAAIARFAERYGKLPDVIRRRLAIENDERQYGLADCLEIHRLTGVPIIFDTFHHSILNRGESVGEATALAAKTWAEKDGPLMVDYSSQDPVKQKGAHCYHVEPDDLRAMLEATRATDYDLMLEIKDKESSALEALQIAQEVGRI